jgi:hypothetical protein
MYKHPVSAREVTHQNATTTSPSAMPRKALSLSTRTMISSLTKERLGLTINNQQNAKKRPTCLPLPQKETCKSPCNHPCIMIEGIAVKAAAEGLPQVVSTSGICTTTLIQVICHLIDEILDY